MAGRKGLTLIGFVYGGVVAVVTLIAVVVVMANVNMSVEARSESMIASAR